MIHSARPIVTPVANIVFCCFSFAKFEKCAKTMIRDFGLSEWIKNYLFLPYKIEEPT